MKKDSGMKKAICCMCLMVLAPFMLNAQNKQSTQSKLIAKYRGFHDDAWKKYEDFRMKCNMKYAEFMKSAWQEYGANPPVAIPEEKRMPLRRYDESKDNTNSVCIATEEVKILPMIDMQPMPLCEIPEVAAVDLSEISLNIDTEIGEEALQKLLPAMKIKKHGKKISYHSRKKAIAKQEKNQQKRQKEILLEEDAEEEEIIPTYSDLPFAFFGTKMKVRVLDDFKYALPDCDGETLSNAWKLLSTPRFNNTIRDCLELRSNYNMCDWAYVEMLQAMADAYLGKGTNEAVFFAAYIYCQSGYQMRLAKKVNKLYMLVASKQFMYNHYFFSIDGIDYFTLEELPYTERLEICNTNFQDESRLSLFIPKSISLDSDMEKTKTVQSLRYDDMSITVTVNKNLMDFYEQYPSSMVDGDFMTRWAMYANTPMDKDVQEQIYPVLRQKLGNYTQREGISRLLNMLQTGLKYGLDEDEWGEDRAFFAEETLYYPVCDCEDKSILFSHLVRELYGLNILLVYFPGHLLTAVRFDEDVEGNYCMYEGEKYVFCDPTYEGASIGRIYPEYLHEKPTVILLNNESKKP